MFPKIIMFEAPLIMYPVIDSNVVVHFLCNLGNKNPEDRASLFSVIYKYLSHSLTNSVLSYLFHSLFRCTNSENAENLKAWKSKGLLHVDHIYIETFIDSLSYITIYW